MPILHPIYYILKPLDIAAVLLCILTKAIQGSLAESYAGGGSMTDNIDKAGGAGTGAFAKEVIDIYIHS